MLPASHTDSTGVDLHELARRVRSATAVTPGLLKAIMAGACTRTRSLAQAGHTGRLEQLVSARAWTDAALELLALELPAWGLRRLVREGGRWNCSLSGWLAVPLEFDDMAEAVHDDPALAILGALIEALGRARGAAGTPASTPGHEFPECPAIRLCCDDFG